VIRHAALLVAVVSVAAFAIQGCGGGSDAASVTVPSKAEFIAKANAVCRQARAEMVVAKRAFERARAGHKPEPGAADVAHFIYLPAMEDQITFIRLLTEPRGETEKIQEMLTVARTAIDRAATTPRIRSIAAAEGYFGKPDRLYRAYGLDDCANSGPGAVRGKGA
jgi:hypothetical protein